MLSLIWAWTKGSENHRDAGDLRHHHTHYEVTIMSFTTFRRYNQPFRVIHDKIEQLSCHIKFYNDHLVRVWMTATQYAHWMWWKNHQWNATKSVTPWMAQQWSEFAWNLYYVCLVCFGGQSLVDICVPLSIGFGLTSLALGQSYDCPNASEITLNDMGKSANVWPQQAQNKHGP